LTLLDAYALVAFLAGEPAETEVRDLLRAGHVGVATANLTEAADALARVHGIEVARTRSVLAPLIDEPIELLGLDAPRAWRAADIRAAHYHRSTCPLSLGDAILLGTADADDTIATADPHVLSVAERRGVATRGLMDARGNRP